MSYKGQCTFGSGDVVADYMRSQQDEKISDFLQSRSLGSWLGQIDPFPLTEIATEASITLKASWWSDCHWLEKSEVSKRLVRWYSSCVSKMAGWGFGASHQRRFLTSSVFLDVRKKLLIEAIWMMDAPDCMLWGKAWALIATFECLRLIIFSFHSARRSIMRMVPDGWTRLLPIVLWRLDRTTSRNPNFDLTSKVTRLENDRAYWSLVKQHVRWPRTSGTSC